MTRSELGALGEEKACGYLTAHGYTVIARNYHSRWGEIDIIARNDEALVFAEVKLRREHAPVSGLEAVNITKMRKIVRTAAVWLAENPSELPARFDVIEIRLKQSGAAGPEVSDIIHIPAAFDTEVCGEVF